MTLSKTLIFSAALFLMAPAAGHAATLYNTSTTQVTTPAPTTATTAAPGIAQSAAAAAAPTPTQAPVAREAAPSAEALTLGKQAGAVCPDKWESAECLKVISTSNLAMASNFGSALQKKGLNADAELVKQHCAASTAAREQTFPAYAMKSAFIECANQVADITAKTGVQPDLSQYQLLVGATMCLDKDMRCAGIADQLKALAAR